MRTGMSEIISDLRGMTEAGDNDWTIGTLVFFSNDMLQNILDRHKESFAYFGMEIEEPVKLNDGTYRWSEYEIEGHTNIEKSTGGTAVFYIQDNTGGTLSAASYSMDYRLGLMTLVTPLAIGTPYFATGSSYDLNAAAAEVWRMKANHAATQFDFTTDNHSIKRSQLYTQYMKMADYYEGLSEEGGSGSGDMERKDTDTC